MYNFYNMMKPYEIQIQQKELELDEEINSC